MAKNQEIICKEVEQIILGSFNPDDPDLPQVSVEEKRQAKRHMTTCKHCHDFYELVIDLRVDPNVDPVIDSLST